MNVFLSIISMQNRPWLFRWVLKNITTFCVLKLINIVIFCLFITTSPLVELVLTLFLWYQIQIFYHTLLRITNECFSFKANVIMEGWWQFFHNNILHLQFSYLCEYQNEQVLHSNYYLNYILFWTFFWNYKHPRWEMIYQKSVGCTVSNSVKIIWCSLWFCTPPYLSQCIALFAVTEGWLLLDIGWFVLFYHFVLTERDCKVIHNDWHPRKHYPRKSLGKDNNAKHEQFYHIAHKALSIKMAIVGFTYWYKET